MLRPEEKERIHLEEVLRHEVQQQLKREIGDKSRWQKVSGFINSAFFLWFLSSAVVGAISFFYTQWEKAKEDERRGYEQQQVVERDRALTEKKLDAEVLSRLNYFASLYKLKGPKAWLVLGRPSEADYPVNVFPEYANRNMQSLLWELLQAARDDQKPEIKQAYDASKYLLTAYLFESSNAVQLRKPNERIAILSKSTKQKDAENYLLGISYLKSLNLKRWGKPLNSIYGERE